MAFQIKIPRNARSRLLAKNVIGSVIVKGWASLVVFLLVPLTLRLLGEYSNGLWMTISAILVWFDQMDIGLGNGLRNRLATYMAHGDTQKAREAISSTLAMLVAIVIPMAALLLAIIWKTNIYALLNVEEARINDLREVLSVIVILFSSTFVLRFVGNVFMGLQLAAANNLIVAAGQTLTLLATLSIYLGSTYARLFPGGEGLFMAIAIANTAAPLIAFATAYIVTFGRLHPELRPQCRSVSWNVAKELITTGVKFFVLQVAGIVLFTSSNMLIQHLFSPEAVTPYQIAYRFFTIVMMVFGIVSTPFWSATTDAYERGDVQWIIDSGRRLNLCLYGLYILIVVMIVISPWFYAIWVGRQVEIPLQLTTAMALYTAVYITSIRYSTILNGCGKLHLQLVMTVGAAVLFIPLSIIAVKAFGTLPSLVIVMAAVNIPGLIVNKIQYNKIINHKATGLWNK